MREIYDEFLLVLVEFAGRIFDGFLFEPEGEFGDGEPGESALDVLLQRVVDELVLLLLNQSTGIAISSWPLSPGGVRLYQTLHQPAARLSQFLQVAEHLQDAIFLQRFQVGVDGHERPRSAATVTNSRISMKCVALQGD